MEIFREPIVCRFETPYTYRGESRKRLEYALIIKKAEKGYVAVCVKEKSSAEYRIRRLYWTEKDIEDHRIDVWELPERVYGAARKGLLFARDQSEEECG